jgi:hypothetical protein
MIWLLFFFLIGTITFKSKILEKYYSKDIKKQIFILLVFYVSYIYANIIIDPYGYEIHKHSSCPPLFSLPILDMYNALFASTLVVFLLKMLKIKYTILELMIIFNVYLLMAGVYAYFYLYSCDVNWFYFALLSQYVGKVTFLYAINLLSLGFLFAEK